MMYRPDIHPSGIRPWYCEPWVWGLMMGPFVVVIAGFITAWIAFKNENDLVVKDYAKQGQLINQIIRRDRAATEKGIGANLMLSGDEKQEIRALITADPGVSLPDMVKLKLIHPIRAQYDEEVDLVKDNSGFYVGKFSQMVDGRRYVHLLTPDDSWRVVGEWVVTPRSTVLLGARSADVN